jgi:DNA primase
MKAVFLFLAATSAALLADEKTLALAKVSSDQDLQEIAAAISAVVYPVQATVEGKAIRVQGSAGNIALAEWIAAELDQPQGRLERVAGNDDDIVRIFEFTDGNTMQEFQEAATLVRSLAEIRRLFTFNAGRRIIARGSKVKMEQAAWLLTRLPASASADTSALKEDSGSLLRVYTLSQFDSIDNFQEAATLIRSITETRSAFTYNPTRKLALRGSAAQMGAVDFLVKELSSATDTKALHRVKQGDLIRVFNYPTASSIMALQEMATVMRTVAGSARVFALNQQKKIVLRGGLEEIQLGEWMLLPTNAKGAFPLGLVREFQLSFATNIQELQEAATVARSLGEIERLIARNDSKTVVVRGSQAQIDLAAWVFQVLSTQPADGRSEHGYGATVAKVLFLKPDLPFADFQQKAVEARRESGTPRLFTYNKSRAVFFCGTAEQVAKAEAVLLRRP